jgi:sugar-specific transcriptional regulator TrmB
MSQSPTSQASNLIDSHVDDLVRIGLSQNQAKVYVSALRSGIVKPSQIAVMCNIERAQGYRILESLSKLGLVEVLSKQPLKYMPVHPDKALLPQRKRLLRLLELEKTLEHNLMSLTDREVDANLNVRAMFLSDGITPQKRLNMIAHCKKDIRMCYPEEKFLDIVYGSDTLWRLTFEDVHARMLTSLSRPDRRIQRIVRQISTCDNLFEIRHIHNTPPSFIITDNKEILLETNLKTGREHFNLWTDHPDYVAIFKDYFRRMWENSVGIQHRVDLLVTGTESIAQSSERRNS